MGLLNKLSKLLLSILALMVIGTIGFHFVEGWSWLDSLYTMVVTLGTVGYGDFTPATDAGKIFVMGLVIIGLGVISYSAVELTAFVVEGHLNRMLRLRKVDNMVKKVSGHYIVCGAGKTGMHIISELVKSKVPFVVIDRDVDKMDNPDIHRHPHITGDASDDAILERAGIRKAKALAATLSSDEANLFLILTAKYLNPKLRIVTKVVNDGARPKLLRAGADAVVAPNFIGGLRMASEMLRPNVVSFLDVMLRQSQGYRFEEAAIGTGSHASGKHLEDLDLFKKFGVNPVAIREGGKDFIYNPSPKHRVKAGDTVVMIAEPEKVQRVKKYLAA